MSLADVFKDDSKESALSVPTDVYQPRKSEHPLVETSLSAYDSVKQVESKLQQEVLFYVITHPRCTQKNAHEYFSIHGFRDASLQDRYRVNGCGYSSVRSRYCELERTGMIKKDSGPRLVQAGKKRYAYIATGRQEPIMCNTTMTYKKKLMCIYEFMLEEYNTSPDCLLKDRIKNVLSEIDLAPVEENQTQLPNI